MQHGSSDGRDSAYRGFYRTDHKSAASDTRLMCVNCADCRLVMLHVGHVCKVANPLCAMLPRQPGLIQQIDSYRPLRHDTRIYMHNSYKTAMSSVSTPAGVGQVTKPM